jgi:predicted restriction endonuclease
MRPVTPDAGARWRHRRGSVQSAVIANAGGRCQWIGDGVRCSATIASGPLEAHHVIPLVPDGGTNDPSNGVALCRRHHRMAERMARAPS